MKINSFQFRDRETNWEIKPINFGMLTLLVGASGVGKTRILNAIRSLQSIARGKSLNGVEWKLDFSIGQDEYTWEGKFELQEKSILDVVASAPDETSSKNKPVIVFEKVVVNDDTIIQRNHNELIFKGNPSPFPVKAEQSVLALINDPLIEGAERGLRKILYSDYSNSAKSPSDVHLINQQIVKKYKSLEEVQNADEHLMDKFYWVFKKNKKTFNQVKNDFIQVFPQVIDIKIETLPEFKNSTLPLFLKSAPFIQFKEKEMSDWLPVMGMSAGMYRTLVHIIELYLSAEGTVILIDEFENSLGINCIDELTNELLGATNRIQFIITSHHPYIINSISYNNWKIVTRKGSVVYTQDAKEFGFDKSKHEAFIQLINLPEYKTGIKQK